MSLSPGASLGSHDVTALIRKGGIGPALDNRDIAQGSFGARRCRMVSVVDEEKKDEAITDSANTEDPQAETTAQEAESPRGTAGLERVDQ